MTTNVATRDKTPKVLFLTPFHFEQPGNNDAFDQLVTSLLGSETAWQFVAEHVPAFEEDGPDYEAAQTAAVVEAVRKANGSDYDVVVIACHYDPALAESRAASSIPVIGLLQLSTALAAPYGPKFGVITDIVEAEQVIGGLVAGYGHAEVCAGVVSIGWDGDRILADTRGAAEAVDRLVVGLAAEGDVQAVVIGCTIVSAAYERHRDEFEDHGIVVLDTNALALKAAATLYSR
jgi:allantoin racemase